MKSKKPFLKKLKIGCLGALGIFLLLIIIAIASDDQEEQESKTQKVPFSQQEITEQTIRETLQDLSGIMVEIDSITEIKINDYAPTTEIPDDKIIDVYYKLQNTSNEEWSIKTAVYTAIKVMESLFKNPKVVEVAMWQQENFTDQYGEKSTDLSVRILMEKETADKIQDWKVIDNRAWNDYNSFFDLAELQYVHPAIRRGL